MLASSTQRDGDSTIPVIQEPPLSSILSPLEPGSRRLYLLRHGETSWNARGLMQGGGFDIELNDNGISQARLAAAQFETFPIKIIASSHLKRAAKTADILHESLPTNSAKRLITEGFGEMRFGEFEGLAIRGPEATSETKNKMKQFQSLMLKDSNLRWPAGGESTNDVMRRSKQSLYKILEDYPDEDHIAVVAHGRMNKVLLAELIFGDASQYDKIQQGNTCVNVVDLDSKSGEWKQQLINYKGHIENLR